MKTVKLLLLSVAAVGLTFFLAKCKKDPPSVVQTYSISGNCTYPTYNTSMALAKGTAVTLYAGTDPNPYARAFADTLGNYSFKGLLPGNYVVKGRYNTLNQNNEKPLSGIDFAVTYNVTLGTANLTQNLVLATIAASSAVNVTIVAADTVGSMGALKYITVESHTNVTYWVEHLDSNAVGLSMNGNFGSNGAGFLLTKFRFDEANPANSYFKGYVLTSKQSSNNIGRDTARGGCVDSFFNHDTTWNATHTVCTTVPVTDTAYYWANAGTISKYGSGYLAHGTLAPCWKHQGIAGGTNYTVNRTDTILGYNGQLGWNTRIQLPCDMYFEYQGKKQVWNAAHTVFNWDLEFEGQFTFRRSQFYMKHGLGDVVTVNPHIQLKGTNNTNY